MKKSLLFLFFIVISVSMFAQMIDTVTVMTYNLTFYRETTSFCTNSNNSPTTKDNAMEDIIDYVLPDILVVNEMGGSNSINPARLQLNALNQNGRSYYKSARRSGSGQSLTNMLYYNEDKFVLESQAEVSKDLNNMDIVRVIDLYTLRYIDSNLSIHKDTTRLRVIAAHLKAGNSTSNEDERAEATEAVMAYLDSNDLDGNFLFAGDLNLYKSTEPAYQDLIDYVDTNLRFYDPINTPGTWSNRSVYAKLHTQSTKKSGTGCFATGGMDDRFDFILASNEIMNNVDKIEYITDTYQALGQDGNRFNESIDSPTNTSVDSIVVVALKNMSDHLPVVMDLKITLPLATSVASFKKPPRLKYVNPASETLRINLSQTPSKVKRVELLNTAGQLLREINVDTRGWVEENIGNLPKGTYLIRVTYDTYQQSIEKLIKI